MRQANWLCVLAVAALVCATPGLLWAQGGDLTPRRTTTDWQEVSTNVFQRTLEDGTVETLTWGLEGVAWELDRVKERIAYLETLSLELEQPSSDLMDSLSRYQSRALELEAELRGEGMASLPLQPQAEGLRSVAGAAGCNLVITRNAAAYPTSTGPAASATAAFSDNCGTFGQVMADAYAEGIYNGAFRSKYERDPASGRRNGYGSASANASASVVATSNCWSDAIARVWVTDSNGNLAFFSKYASNDKCRIVIELPGPECLSSGLQNCPV